MSQADSQEILELTQKLLDCVASGDWEVYQLLCDPTLSAFEPEARGHLVEGLDFHQFYFGLPRTSKRVNTTISAPRVRMLSDDAAVVTLIRLMQWADEQGQSRTTKFEETRVWQRIDGQWRHVHFHRSANE